MQLRLFVYALYKVTILLIFTPVYGACSTSAWVVTRLPGPFLENGSNLAASHSWTYLSIGFRMSLLPIAYGIDLQTVINTHSVLHVKSKLAFGVDNWLSCCCNEQAVVICLHGKSDCTISAP